MKLGEFFSSSLVTLSFVSLASVGVGSFISSLQFLDNLQTGGDTLILNQVCRDF